MPYEQPLCQIHAVSAESSTLIIFPKPSSQPHDSIILIKIFTREHPTIVSIYWWFSFRRRFYSHSHNWLPNGSALASEITCIASLSNHYSFSFNPKWSWLHMKILIPPVSSSSQPFKSNLPKSSQVTKRGMELGCIPCRCLKSDAPRGIQPLLAALALAALALAALALAALALAALALALAGRRVRHGNAECFLGLLGLTSDHLMIIWLSGFN